MTDISCCNTGVIGKRWHSQPSWRTPLSPSHFFLVSWSSSTSHPLPASHSSQPPTTFGSPIHSPWNPNPSWSPIVLQAPTASRPPTIFWCPTHLLPPRVPPSYSGLPPHYSASHPPPASNPFSASQPFLNSHFSSWPDTLIFGLTLSFLV